jgi:hypothetical protein
MCSAYEVFLITVGSCVVDEKQNLPVGSRPLPVNSAA